VVTTIAVVLGIRLGEHQDAHVHPGMRREVLKLQYTETLFNKNRTGNQYPMVK